MILKIRWLLGINWFKTIRVNIRALGISGALKLPMHVEWGARVSAPRGSVAFECPLRSGIVRFSKRCSLDLCGHIVFRGVANFGPGCAMHVARGAVLVTGDNLVVTSELSLNCLKRIAIGNDVLIAWRCTILDGDFHPIRDASGTILNENRPIDIGNHVWIGNNTLILKGVTIAGGSVVGAGSVVARNLPDERCVYAGSPARKLRENIQWDPF